MSIKHAKGKREDHHDDKKRFVSLDALRESTTNFIGTYNTLMSEGIDKRGIQGKPIFFAHDI